MFCNLQSDLGVSNFWFFITICQNCFEPSGTNALYIDSAAAVYNYSRFYRFSLKGELFFELLLLKYSVWY